MTPLAKGRIVLWQGGSLWALRVTEPPGAPKSTDFHAHHAIQVTLALDGRYGLHLPDRSIGGPAFVDFLKKDTNGVVTLILVRETLESDGAGLVHGFASRHHPSAEPPTLKLVVRP